MQRHKVVIYEDRISSRREEAAKKTQGKTFSPARISPHILTTIPYEYPQCAIKVSLSSDEFTCICPITGQPDFATITIRYIPDQRIVESKSLKLYLWSYRNEGAFHEHVTNQILDGLVEALDPLYCHVNGAFNVRGGISITVDAEYEKPSK